MDAFDPLADAPPPRYAVESDDEDEFTPSSTHPTRSESDQPPDVTVQFKSLHDTPLPIGKPLLVASGEAGVRWATVVHLGEQQAAIHVNTLPVGLLFCPSWTNAVIVVSEAETRTRLPRFAMTAYTTAIIARLQPTSVAILDSYATKVYISPRVIYQDNAPIRYLSAGNWKQPVDNAGLELFAPPNLLQSTTASLLNELFLRSASGDTTRDLSTVLLLLPCPKVLPPPPTTFDGRGAAGEFPDTNWDRDTLERAHRWLFSVIGEEVGGSSLRARAEFATRSLVPRSTLGEVGEGSMYI